MNLIFVNITHRDGVALGTAEAKYILEENIGSLISESGGGSTFFLYEEELEGALGAGYNSSEVIVSQPISYFSQFFLSGPVEVSGSTENRVIPRHLVLNAKYVTGTGYELRIKTDTATGGSIVDAVLDLPATAANYISGNGEPLSMVFAKSGEVVGSVANTKSNVFTHNLFLPSSLYLVSLEYYYRIESPGIIQVELDFFGNLLGDGSGNVQVETMTVLPGSEYKAFSKSFVVNIGASADGDITLAMESDQNADLKVRGAILKIEKINNYVNKDIA